MRNFSNLVDLKEKIAYYLQHSDKREAMARKLQQKVYAEHTYQHLFEEMLKIISAI
ncbi:MAG: glycosyltransferase family 1 protein [Thiomargarita sp.]|nr:glycosyltransferase family 1 protein [Thiomargarita sp.]